MALSGYAKSYNSRRNGGIQQLALIQVAEFIGAEYDTLARAYTDITLQPGQRFATYDFREDEAEYLAKVDILQGAVVVTHELRFLLDKMSNASSSAVAELLDSSFGGFIALIKTYANEIYLIGYSPEFGTQRPLHVVQANCTTGKRFTDPTSEIVVLQSTDTAKARTVFKNIDDLLKA